jgi:hypothetical protein
LFPYFLFLAETIKLRGKSFDVWSLGVTLFCFVHGYCPFEDEVIFDLHQKIIHDEPKISERLSPPLQQLIRGMLQKIPKDRLTLPEIRVHPWVTRNGTDPMISEEENCVYEDVTEEEVKNAFRPAEMVWNKVKFSASSLIVGGTNFYSFSIPQIKNILSLTLPRSNRGQRATTSIPLPPPPKYTRSSSDLGTKQQQKNIMLTNFNLPAQIFNKVSGGGGNGGESVQSQQLQQKNYNQSQSQSQVQPSSSSGGITRGTTMGLNRLSMRESKSTEVLSPGNHYLHHNQHQNYHHHNQQHQHQNHQNNQSRDFCSGESVSSSGISDPTTSSTCAIDSQPAPFYTLQRPASAQASSSYSKSASSYNYQTQQSTSSHLQQQQLQQQQQMSSSAGKSLGNHPMTGRLHGLHNRPSRNSFGSMIDVIGNQVLPN